MNHLTEDTILKYELETLENDEMLSAQNHLKNCDICSVQMNKIKEELKVIGSYDPAIEDFYFLPLKNKTNKWLKAAAVLILGFFTGYLTSDYFQPVQINVTAQTIIPKPPQIDSTEFVVCPNVDILN